MGRKTLAIAAVVFIGSAANAQHDSKFSNTKQVDTFKKIQMEKIKFLSDGLVLAGNLFKPQNFDPSKKYYAIVTGGSLTSVKEQMPGTYAEKLADKGFIALAFDYRNYGESEGQPRQYEDPELKLRDLEAAVTYLLSLPYVKSVGALGVCTSGGNVAYLAAHDQRIKAVAVVAAHMPDASILPLFYGSRENVDALRKAGAEAKKKYGLTGINTIIPAYSNIDKSASHIGPMEYYMDNTRGGGVKEWKNEFSVTSWGTWLDFDPISKAQTISTPFIMFHSDRCALPASAKKFYVLLKGKKELVWGDGYHFDYYDKPEQITAVVEKAGEFFQKNLK